MLDIKFVRTNPELVKEGLARRGKNMDALIDEVIELDKVRREISSNNDALKARQNAVSKEIPMLKKEGKDTTAIFAEMKELSNKIKADDEKLAEIEEKQKNIIMTIPNIPHESVPAGADDSQNLEVRRWGEPRNFGFEPKAHWDIGENLDILDPETAAKVTGARFHFYKDLGARLERAIMNYFLDTHTANGYTEIFPPFMANKASMTGTGQLPKFEEDAFKIDGQDYF